MQVNRFDTYLDALNYLRPQGYVHSYQADGPAIRGVEINLCYAPAEMTLCVSTASRATKTSATCRCFT